MAGPSNSHQKFMSETQFPRLEVLSSMPMTESAIFPTLEPDDPLGPLGNYGRGADPTPLSPLFSVRGEITAIREKATARHAGRPDPEDKLKRIMRGTVIQLKLVGFISRGYQNLIADDVSEFEAAYEIEDYIEAQEDSKHKEFESNRGYYQGLIDAIERGNGLFIPSGATDDAFILDEDGAPPMPASPELQREAFKRLAEGERDQNELLIERLDFEWVSSKVIVNKLRENLTDALDPNNLI